MGRRSAQIRADIAKNAPATQRRKSCFPRDLCGSTPVSKFGEPGQPRPLRKHHIGQARGPRVAALAGLDRGTRRLGPAAANPVAAFERIWRAAGPLPAAFFVRAAPERAEEIALRLPDQPVAGRRGERQPLFERQPAGKAACGRTCSHDHPRWFLTNAVRRCGGLISLVIARSEATKQSRLRRRRSTQRLDCFAALAMTREIVLAARSATRDQRRACETSRPWIVA